MSKITVVIDDELLKAAIEATGPKTMRSVVERGLRELVRRANLEALRSELGTFDLAVSP